MGTTIIAEKTAVCPICKRSIQPDKGKLSWWPKKLFGSYDSFHCTFPMKDNLLHSYRLLREVRFPYKTIYEQMSVDVDSQYIIVGLDYKNEETLIKQKEHSDPTIYKFLINPDFPKLNKFTEKIKNIIIFG